MPRNIVLFCFLTVSLVFAYNENSMPGLDVPTQLDPKSLEASIVHRFYRSPTANFPDNFITMANVMLGLKYVILPKLEAGTSYQFMGKEYAFHAAYSLFFPKAFLRTQALVRFFGAQRDNDTLWNENFLYEINFQSEPIAGRFLPVINLAYNGLTKKVGLGTGLDVVIFRNFDFLAEYYPVLGTRETVLYSETKKVNCFLAGLKYSTPGHQFMFTISNNYDIGNRRHMAGATDNTLYYGFNIQRLFSF
jgi:hypothetical protein